MASVISTGFGPILLACKQQLIAQLPPLTASPTSALIVTNDNAPILNADFDVVLRPGSFISIRESFDGAGQTCNKFQRYLIMYPRVRVTLDETGRDEVFATDPALGLLPWEEQCANCLIGFFPIDASLNQLTTQEIRPASGSDPRRHPLDDTWGTSAVTLEVEYTFTLNAVRWRPPLILTAALPGGTHGIAYATTLTATSPEPGTTPYTWSVVGSLPTGLTIGATTGTIGGTPAAAGITPITVICTDSNGQRAVAYLSLTVV